MLSTNWEIETYPSLSNAVKHTSMSNRVSSSTETSPLGSTQLGALNMLFSYCGCCGFFKMRATKTFINLYVSIQYLIDVFNNTI